MAKKNTNWIRFALFLVWNGKKTTVRTPADPYKHSISLVSWVYATRIQMKSFLERLNPPVSRVFYPFILRNEQLGF